MPVLHLPTLRESAYNTPAETPNSKSLRRLQIPRTTPGITEESYRHFWHGNQGEAYSEVFTTQSFQTREKPIYTLDEALTYALSPKLQLDCGANFSLNDVAPRAQLYTGLSQRF
jgi:hypothetical protein